MTWIEFRELSRKEQNQIMDKYEMHIQSQLKDLKDTKWASSDTYQQIYKRIASTSLNEFLEELRYNEIDGIWELNE